jgi:hypothetical protein
MLNITSNAEGSLTVDFEDDYAYHHAMTIDGNDIDSWHYHSEHWTSPDLLDDGSSLKTRFFNKPYNKIRIDMYVEGAGGLYSATAQSVEWTHNLGLSLQEIFSSNQYHDANEANTGSWKGLLGNTKADANQYKIARGFNLQIQTIGYIGSAVEIGDLEDACGTTGCADANGVVHTRLGAAYARQNPELFPSGVTTLVGAGFNAETTVRRGRNTAAGGHCSGSVVGGGEVLCPESSSLTGQGIRQGTPVGKVKIYVGNQGAGCRNYTVTTDPPTVSTTTTDTPAALAGLDPTSPGLLVSMSARSAIGSGPTATYTTPVRPCRCACEVFASPSITAVSATRGDGVLTVNFTQPANIPTGCDIQYNITTEPPRPKIVASQYHEYAGNCSVCGEDRIVVPLQPSERAVECGNTTGRTVGVGVGGMFMDGHPYCDSCAVTCGDLCKARPGKCGTRLRLGYTSVYYRIVCASQAWAPPFTTIEGLDPTISYTVKIAASNGFGSSPTAISSPIRPCFCSCETPNSPAITSAVSHLEGSLTIKFNGPTNVPPECNNGGHGIVYTYEGAQRIHSDSHSPLTFTVTAVPTTGSSAVKAVTATFPTTIGTLTGLDPTIGYTVHVRASNAAGMGPASTTVMDAVPMPNGGNTRAQSWSSIRDFVHGLTRDRPTDATFTLLSPQQDPSAVYNGQIYVGFANLVIYGDGAVIDANGTGRFFDMSDGSYLGHQPSLTLFNLTMRHGRTGPYNTGCSGGAIHAISPKLLALYDCSLEYNTQPPGQSDGDGGAIRSWYSLNTSIIRCLFYGNEADVGGALDLRQNYRAYIHYNRFLKNVAGRFKGIDNGNGGGFGVAGAAYIKGWGLVEIIGNEFIENTAAYVAGALSWNNLDLTVPDGSLDGTIEYLDSGKRFWDDKDKYLDSDDYFGDPVFRSNTFTRNHAVSFVCESQHPTF